ncbi:Nuclease NucM precursor [Legionella massiliensis]|uniref:Nuclease NucM n=1 Tax=Legionella massiliensis TaxID=1034943 RepID=A0A078L2B9_9GAMM|nr:endonuclease [Legionella massiliensis]CDZ79367.1 Nuclease NucM precursor [Legionella massiliensis]CEE15105.1 Nuclease NucM precursor [Legionella massiliensis]
MRFLLYSVLCLSHFVWAESPNSFNQSKKIVQQLFKNHPQTIYCGCTYQDKTVHLDSCGMSEAGTKSRANRIEIEHVMAVEHFSQHFDCWRIPICTDAQGRAFKGRKCCEHVDAQFRHVESELYNLWPAVGLINQARSNYRFGVLPGNDRYYGCSFKIDKRLRRVEPADEVKGIVARAYLFMSDYYQISLSSAQRQLFQAWNRQFAPTIWELTWAEKVAELEGYPNPYISQWETQKNKT